MTLTRKQIAYLLIETLAETGGGPSGHCYAALQHAGVTLDEYQTVLSVLQSAKLIKNQGHWLTYIGPALDSK